MGKDVEILVIGNGFDIAHGLPTKYTDFIVFCRGAIAYHLKTDVKNNKVFIDVLKKSNCYDELNGEIHLSEENNAFCKAIHDNMYENIWGKYLNELLKNEFSGENWIDFESEISHIIQFLDSGENHLNDDLGRFCYEFEKTLKGDPSLDEAKNIIFVHLINEYMKERLTFRKLRKMLFDDLSKLINALEIYFYEFVEKIDICDRNKYLDALKPDMILTFNYTHTYRPVFELLNPENVFHLHGECGKENFTNNMVLGIDEYYIDEKKNTNTDYAIFKKYVQRVQKKTFIGFKKLLSIIDNINTGENININGVSITKKKIVLHFFGHSLDVTDKDTLKRLFDLPVRKIFVYCKDSETEGEYIANIIKIIGQDELMMRTENGLLEFIV